MEKISLPKNVKCKPDLSTLIAHYTRNEEEVCAICFTGIHYMGELDLIKDPGNACFYSFVCETCSFENCELVKTNEYRKTHAKKSTKI